MGDRGTADPAARQNPRGGRPRQVDMREVLNTLLSLHRSGCQWQMLPHDVLPKSTVYDYFAQWRDVRDHRVAIHGRHGS